jgi:hypothetical protein
MAERSNGRLDFINFSKLNLTTDKVREKLGKSVRGQSKKNSERCQFLKWIVSCFESLPPYINKEDIEVSNLQSIDKTLDEVFDKFCNELARFINFDQDHISSTSEHGTFSMRPLSKEGDEASYA